MHTNVRYQAHCLVTCCWDLRLLSSKLAITIAQSVCQTALRGCMCPK